MIFTNEALEIIQRIEREQRKERRFGSYCKDIDTALKYYRHDSFVEVVEQSWKCQIVIYGGCTNCGLEFTETLSDEILASLPFLGDDWCIDQMIEKLLIVPRRFCPLAGVGLDQVFGLEDAPI